MDFALILNEVDTLTVEQIKALEARIKERKAVLKDEIAEAEAQAKVDAAEAVKTLKLGMTVRCKFGKGETIEGVIEKFTDSGFSIRKEGADKLLPRRADSFIAIVADAPEGFEEELEAAKKAKAKAAREAKKSQKDGM